MDVSARANETRHSGHTTNKFGKLVWQPKTEAERSSLSRSMPRCAWALRRLKLWAWATGASNVRENIAVLVASIQGFRSSLALKAAAGIRIIIQGFRHCGGMKRL